MTLVRRTAGAICLALAMTASSLEAADLRLAPPLLPAAMQGLWAYEPDDCSNPDSDGLLTIGGRAVDFFASAYDVTGIVRRPGGAVRAFGLRSDEGEDGRKPDDLTLRLLAPDRLHVVTNSPEGHIYHRCKAGRF
jgi:hypothetical protein